MVRQYKTGENIRDGNAVSEWLRYNDILLRQHLQISKYQKGHRWVSFLMCGNIDKRDIYFKR